MVDTFQRRIIRGMGANATGQVVTILIQLVSLPLFLNYWSQESYGRWLMLSAIPAYLGMADLGMTATAGTRMTMATGKGDYSSANAVFQTAQAFLACTCLGLALIVFPTIWLIEIPGSPTAEDRLALAALVGSIFVALFGGLVDTLFRSTGRYATGVLLGNVTRLIEWIGGLLGLVVWGDFVGVAAGGLAMRLLGTLVTARLAKPSNYGLSWGVRSATAEETRLMLKPAATYMIFPLSNALTFQATTLLVGLLLGTATVAIFNTYRTLARAAVQFTAIFSHSIAPEFSRLYGLGRVETIRHLYARSLQLGIAQSFGLSLLIYGVSPWVIEVWTHGVIPFEYELLLVLLIYATIGGVWHVPRILLLSTNSHVALSYWLLTSSIALLALAAAFVPLLGLNGMGLAMILSEMLIAVVSMAKARSFFVGLASLPHRADV